MKLFDDPIFHLAQKALEENKLLVAALSAFLTFLALRFVHRCFLSEEPPCVEDKMMTDQEAEESPPPVKDKAGELDDRALIEAFENARPPKDPIHGFIDGERDKVPFMCPFFEAFKMAQKRAEKEQDEEDNIARAQQSRDQKSTAKSPEKSAPAPMNSAPAPMNSAPAPEKEPKADAGSQQPQDASCSAPCDDPAELKNVLGTVPLSHLPGCLKRQEQGKLLNGLSDGEMAREREAVNHQLREIYALLAQQHEGSQPGNTSMDEVYSQMKLYAH